VLRYTNAYQQRAGIAAIEKIAACRICLLPSR